MLASQQTNDERSESRADTPQLAAGSFIMTTARHISQPFSEIFPCNSALAMLP